MTRPLNVVPQIRWTKAGASDRLNDSYLHNETLRIKNISRHQGGRYYCKAENRHGVPAIRSIRVEVYCKQLRQLFDKMNIYVYSC